MSHNNITINRSAATFVVVLSVLTILFSLLAWVIDYHGMKPHRTKIDLPALDTYFYLDPPQEIYTPEPQRPIIIGLTIITLFCVARWLYHSNKNLTILGAHNLRFSPAWAACYFFMPGINLIRVPQILAEIWHVSDSQELNTDNYTSWRGIPVLISLWWFFVVAAPLLALLSTTLVALVSSSRFWITAAFWCYFIVPHVMTILLVRTVARKQLRKQIEQRAGSHRN